MQIQKCELVLIPTYPVGEDSLVSDRPKKEVSERCCGEGCELELSSAEGASTKQIRLLGFAAKKVFESLKTSLCARYLVVGIDCCNYRLDMSPVPLHQ